MSDDMIERVSYRTWANDIAAKVPAKALRIESFRAGAGEPAWAKATNLETGETWEWSRTDLSTPATPA